MNLHAPQTIQTQTELAMIADIKKQIITPKDGSAIVKPVQDTVLGSYKMTQADVKIEWDDMMNILVFSYNVPLEEINIQKNKSYSGSELFSTIIPKGINLSSSKLTIADGELEKGEVNKKVLRDIVNSSWDRYASKETMDFIDNTQRYVINWLLMEGFTVGLGDCLIPKESLAKIHIEVEKKKLEVNHLITEIENNPELLDADTFEQSLKANLAAQKGDIQKIVMNSLNNNNNFYVMVNSGSKGSPVNAMQIMGALGQDIFKQNRIQKDVLNRSLPHFFQNDDTALARGYIEHSYYEGLSPQEFFFHHMTGREGLIDTAIKTAETGYISRRLMKALEDIGVKYDGLVRTGNGIVVQYIYGDNNLNQIKQRKLILKSLKMGNKELKSVYQFTDAELKTVQQKSKIDMTKLKKLNTTFYENIKSLRDQFRKIQRFHNLNYKTLRTTYQLPINLVRVINDTIKSKSGDDKNQYCDPEYVINQLEHILDPSVTRLLYMSQKEVSIKNFSKLADEKISKTLFRYALYDFLGPKRVIMEYKLSKYKFNMIVDEIIRVFKDAMVEAGEMVGCVAAQHIGEVATQMTLNSVEYNTEIVVKVNDTEKIVKIGEFIDRYIETSNDDKIEKHDNDTTLAYTKDDHKLEIESVDEDGNVSWKKIEAVTKHPPINKDGSNVLVHVTTLSGREVIATKAKSFLTLENGKLVPTKGEDINIGDYLPVHCAIDMRYEMKPVNGNKLTIDDISYNENSGMKDKNIYFDKIISIEEFTSDRKYVYDLTVEDTRNFNLYNGLCMRDTFHATGSGSTGMQGVPRCEELIRVTKNIKTPIMKIYVKPEKRLDKDFVNKLGSSIGYTIFSDVIDSYEIIFDLDTVNSGYTKKDSVRNAFNADIKSVATKKFDNLEWLIRVKLDRNKMIEKNVTLIDIKTQFVKFWKYKLSNNKGLKKQEKNIINSIVGSAILSNYDNSETPIVHIRFSLSELNYNLLIDIQKWFFENIKLKGLENIEKILDIPEELLISFNNEDEAFEESKEYVIATAGIDIENLRRLSNIDHDRTYCNDIRTIYKYYGIEAVRSTLIKELTQVYSDHSVGFHHISLLADIMTNTGTMTSIDRHGLNKLDRDPFSRASFEMPMSQLIDAAVHNEIDTVSSVSSQIMVGRVITGGTGLPQVILDTDMIEKSEYLEDLELVNQDEFLRLESNELLNDIIAKDSFDMFMPV